MPSILRSMIFAVHTVKFLACRNNICNRPQINDDSLLFRMTRYKMLCLYNELFLRPPWLCAIALVISYMASYYHKYTQDLVQNITYMPPILTVSRFCQKFTKNLQL